MPWPELIETFNPWEGIRAGQRSLGAALRSRCREENSECSGRGGEMSQSFFVLFASACLKPRQSCDKSSSSGNSNQQTPRLRRQEATCLIGGAAVQTGWRKPCYLHLPSHCSREWTVTGSELQSTSVLARGLARQGWKVPHGKGRPWESSPFRDEFLGSPLRYTCRIWPCTALPGYWAVHMWIRSK